MSKDKSEPEKNQNQALINELKECGYSEGQIENLKTPQLMKVKDNHQMFIGRGFNHRQISSIANAKKTDTLASLVELLKKDESSTFTAGQLFLLYKNKAVQDNYFNQIANLLEINPNIWSDLKKEGLNMTKLVDLVNELESLSNSVKYATKENLDITTLITLFSGGVWSKLMEAGYEMKFLITILHGKSPRGGLYNLKSLIDFVSDATLHDTVKKASLQNRTFDVVHIAKILSRENGHKSLDKLVELIQNEALWNDLKEYGTDILTIVQLLDHHSSHTSLSSYLKMVAEAKLNKLSMKDEKVNIDKPELFTKDQIANILKYDGGNHALEAMNDLLLDTSPEILNILSKFKKDDIIRTAFTYAGQAKVTSIRNLAAKVSPKEGTSTTDPSNEKTNLDALLEAEFTINDCITILRKGGGAKDLDDLVELVTNKDLWDKVLSKGFTQKKLFKILTKGTAHKALGCLIKLINDENLWKKLETVDLNQDKLFDMLNQPSAATQFQRFLLKDASNAAIELEKQLFSVEKTDTKNKKNNKIETVKKTHEKEKTSESKEAIEVWKDSNGKLYEGDASSSSSIRVQATRAEDGSLREVRTPTVTIYLHRRSDSEGYDWCTDGTSPEESNQFDRVLMPLSVWQLSLSVTMFRPMSSRLPAQVVSTVYSSSSLADIFSTPRFISTSSSDSLVQGGDSLVDATDNSEDVGNEEKHDMLVDANDNSEDVGNEENHDMLVDATDNSEDVGNEENHAVLFIKHNSSEDVYNEKNNSKNVKKRKKIDAEEPEFQKKHKKDEDPDDSGSDSEEEFIMPRIFKTSPVGSSKQKSSSISKSSSSSGEQDLVDSGVCENNTNTLYEIAKGYVPVLGEISLAIISVAAATSTSSPYEIAKGYVPVLGEISLAITSVAAATSMFSQEYSVESCLSNFNDLSALLGTYSSLPLDNGIFG